jgi:hypothetical protein
MQDRITEAKQEEERDRMTKRDSLPDEDIAQPTAV